MLLVYEHDCSPMFSASFACDVEMYIHFQVQDTVHEYIGFTVTTPKTCRGIFIGRCANLYVTPTQITAHPNISEIISDQVEQSHATCVTPNLQLFTNGRGNWSFPAGLTKCMVAARVRIIEIKRS